MLQMLKVLSAKSDNQNSTSETKLVQRQNQYGTKWSKERKKRVPSLRPKWYRELLSSNLHMHEVPSNKINQCNKNPFKERTGLGGYNKHSFTRRQEWVSEWSKQVRNQKTYVIAGNLSSICCLTPGSHCPSKSVSSEQSVDKMKSSLKCCPFLRAYDSLTSCL